jgi:hypothetical protein
MRSEPLRMRMAKLTSELCIRSVSGLFAIVLNTKSILVDRNFNTAMDTTAIRARISAHILFL